MEGAAGGKPSTSFRRCEKGRRFRFSSLRGSARYAAPQPGKSGSECGCGGIGRRAALRSLWANPREGSSPFNRTTLLFFSALAGLRDGRGVAVPRGYARPSRHMLCPAVSDSPRAPHNPHGSGKGNPGTVAALNDPRDFFFLPVAAGRGAPLMSAAAPEPSAAPHPARHSAGAAGGVRFRCRNPAIGRHAARRACRNCAR